jgi:hypothetical protein
MNNCLNSSLLGEIQITPDRFPAIESVIETFKDEQFLALSWRKQFRKINEALCKLIVDSPHPSFLLSSVLDFIERINHNGIAKESYNLALFEFWLTNFSNLSDAENYEIRAKIAGKYVPRSDYQGIFPIGMNKAYSGSHFVIAHLSPDIDTMIASFWGWLDAFAARIGTALHQWFLPDGPPDSPFTLIFQEMIGKDLFNSIPRTTSSLSLTSIDLVNQRNLIKLSGETLTSNLISQEYSGKAIVLVDELGHYLGDWHPADLESTRQITIPFKACLRWFENNLHANLISCFAKDQLSSDILSECLSDVVNTKIKDCEPALEFNDKQIKLLDVFFKKIFKLDKGLESSYRDLNLALKMQLNGKMADFQTELKNLHSSSIFNENGFLIEARPKIFDLLKNMITLLDKAMLEARNYVDRLDIQLRIKQDVLGIPPSYLTLQSDVEEMRVKMEHLDYLTVVIQETDDKLFPIGIVHSSDLMRNNLGTVTFRDFCNLEEVKMSSYFEVISVMDHHKNALKTSTVPAAIIADVQSCNILLAEQAFLINDRYSLGGLAKDQIDNQIKKLTSLSDCTSSELRIQQRLLQRKLAANYHSSYFIHPKREYCEYLCFLQAILDDTDLLTKVSVRDLTCIAELLNRLKSLSIGQEVEIISFDDIPRDKDFILKASQRILQQPDMYSIYKHVYQLKEQSIAANLELCIKGKDSNIFIDAKEQNGCARVGQTKLFKQNYPYFLEHAMEIRKTWLKKSQSVHNEQPEIDLHMHMISTIASAEEVYNSQIGPYTHLDELWLWIPETQSALIHLKSFLTNFQFGAKKALEQLSLEFIGKKSLDKVQIFSQTFPEAKQSFTEDKLTEYSIAVLRFKAGKLNSRKSMISPFLPRLLT